MLPAPNPKTPRTWGGYSPDEKEKAIYRSASRLFLREYLASPSFPRLEDIGQRVVNGILPEPLERTELEAALAPLLPEREYHFCSYVKELDTLLLQDSTPLQAQPFYQRLGERIEKLSEELDEYNISLTDFHTLLGIYILNQARKQGMVSANTTKPGYFIKSCSQ